MSRMREAFERFLAPLKRRVFMMIARGVIENVDDSKLLQHVQVSLLKDEIRNDVERFQEYGFTSVPLPGEGCEAVALFLQGNRDHGIIIAVEDRQYRLKNLENGEVAIYTDEGDKIHLKRGNEIQISTETLTIDATTKLEINSPIVEMNASAQFVANVGITQQLNMLPAATVLSVSSLDINKV